MTSYGPIGTLARDGETPVITFSRTFAAPPEVVWEALTTADGVESWLAASATIEAGPDGSVDLEFDEENQVTGAITVWEPHTRFAHEWLINGEFPSEVFYELTPTDGGTDLVLVHRGLPDEMTGGYTPGWHAYLVRLDARLTGDAIPDWMDIFQAVAGEYG